MNALILKTETTFEEAVRQLDRNGNGFLPIVDEDRKLLGIITDGDLRRAILNKEFEITKMMNPRPITAGVNTPHVEIRMQLKAIHRRHMPVVDEEGRLVNVVILDDFEVTTKENWVVIMAGGMGTRLGDLTRNVPKPMLEVGGKPILLGIIEDFKSQGYCKFVLCVNHLSHVIESFFGDGSRFGVQIRYTREEKKLGTAGALSLIDIDMKEPFIVTNGDILVSLKYDDLVDFHTINHSKATMCIKLFSYEVPFACVEFDGEHSLKKLREKPSFEYFVNAGIYILDPSVLQLIPHNEYYDMPTLFDELLKREAVTKIFKLNNYWLDIGRPEDYHKGNNVLSRNGK